MVIGHSRGDDETVATGPVDAANASNPASAAPAELSRRKLLRRAGATAVAVGTAGLAAGAAAIANAAPALASGSDGSNILVGGHYLDVQSTTWLKDNANNANVFVAQSAGDGIGVYGTSKSDVGVLGSSHSGNGVRGTSADSPGVHGESVAGAGVRGHSQEDWGVHGSSDQTAGVFGWSSGSTGVAGSSDTGKGMEGYSNYGTGVSGRSLYSWGVQGESVDDVAVRGSSTSGMGAYAQSTHSDGVMGVALEANRGVRGESGGGCGVYGFSGPYRGIRPVPSNVGVYGASPAGRGAVFTGGASQVRLLPSSAATHPASGLAGDLFLDASSRLWLCKGGAAWVQVA